MDTPDRITLAGESHAVVLPAWAEREELALAYGDLIRRRGSEDEGLSPQLLRIYTAAIGLAVPRIARRAAEADERTSYLRCGCSPLEYGGRLYNHLREQGVPAVEIATAGIKVLELVGEKIAPRRAEVEAAANFTGPGAERQRA